MSENKLVAIVNGKEISRNDVLQFLNDMGPQMAMQFQSPEGIKRVVDELVNQELLYLDAVESKFEDEAEFQQMLNTAKVNLLKNYAFTKVVADEQVTEEEMLNYYNENKEGFNKPETVKASHILIDSEEKANDILKETNSGLSFEEAAIKYSSCPSKEDGGNLGEFARGQMVPEFENEAFAMEVDTISKPVKSQFGYHLIKLVEKNEAKESSFEEVKDEIYSHLVRLKQQDKYMEKINNLKDEFKVELF